ncbi:chromatin structure-remodeling complex protein Rsc58p [[Candida] railenensis]|uniref:Chromatin structure-remodeling complex protein Rsc58p n=1 Tax=[Candida] railenensis TaxID=45579 RepID=A0A9P0VX89_9ASCO|nr:chromatin structure-remodeling complex protein Rsc58p [[Candida] railenensis]
MSNTKDISSFLKDIYTVIQLADSDSKVLSTPIPKSFLEEKPDDILDSFAEHIKEHPLDDEATTTSINLKIEKKEYKSFYQLFHDIKISSSSLIQKYKVGSSIYNRIDFFYKFTTELLLRESSRLRLSLSTTESSEETDFESQFAEDFDKISSTYSSENGEVIYLINKIDDPASIQQPIQSSLYPHNQQQPEPPKQKNQPLFTSLTGKSSVDKRPTLIPDPYQLTQVVPNSRLAYRESAKLNSLSPPISKIPPPTSQPTEMMNNFFHPNWYTLAVPSWLNYQAVRKQISSGATSFTGKTTDEVSSTKAYNSYVKSFAPTVDSRSSIISQDFKSNIWLEHIGFDEINEIRDRFLESKKPLIESSIEDSVDKITSDEETKVAVEGDDEIKNEEPINGKVEGTESEINGNTAGETAQKENETATDAETDAPKISLDNLINWDPSKIELLDDLKEDAEKIIESPKSFQRLISVHLLKLNKLRQQRFVGSNPSPIPSPVEIKLYEKIMKLLTLFMKNNNVTTNQLSLQFSKRLPVLMNEYVGSLPGSVVSTKNYTGNIPKNARLPSIRGPYKKKNRM